MNAGLKSETGKKIFALFLAILLLSGIGIWVADRLILSDLRILPNISLAHVPVGGMNETEAKAVILAAYTKALKYPVLLATDDKVWTVMPEQIGLKLDIKKTFVSAYSVGRGTDFWTRWQDRLMCRENSINLPIYISFDPQRLNLFLQQLRPTVERKPRDADLLVLMKSKTVALIPAIDGRQLDIVKTMQEAFAEPQQQFYFAVSLKFTPALPKVTDQHFAGINRMLSLYSTHFKPWDYDRNANLRLATQRIHGTLIKPNQTFSYNATVGNRTQQQGFRMAPVIFDGKLIPDWGGGVCQVSSTLYNAVLLADLQIVERSNHGRAIGYVPLGFDATVVDGMIDFKFKNSLSRPIMLYSLVTDDELFFSVLGDLLDKPPPIELDYVVHKVIEPIEIRQPDPMLEIGKEVIDEPPQRGFKVASYRIRKLENKEERQLLALDDYDPVNRIIKVGTKPPNQLKTQPAPAPQAGPPGGSTSNSGVR